MSKASDRARALLAAATQGRWAVSTHSGLLCAENGGVTTPAVLATTASDCALIAEACSPEGGLLAKLCDEVEHFETFLHEVAVRRGVVGHVLDVPTLAADNARLRAALEALREEHYFPCPQLSVPGVIMGTVGECDCGSAEHNARIDAALRGDG